MKSLTILFLSLVVFCKTGFSQIDTINLKKQAQICANATLKRDYKTLLKYTHPNIIKLAGGADKMEAEVKAGMTAMDQRQISMVADRLGNIAGGPVNAGSEIHALLQHTIVMKFQDKYMKMNSYLLAVSMDKGKNWVFADVAGLRKSGPKSVFPNYNPALKIPPATPPQISDKP